MFGGQVQGEGTYRVGRSNVPMYRIRTIRGAEDVLFKSDALLLGYR